MSAFAISQININGANVSFEINRPVGINYMIYLTCQLKNNYHIKLCGSEDNIIYFKLSDSVLENQEICHDLIEYLVSLIV